MTSVGPSGRVSIVRAARRKLDPYRCGRCSERTNRCAECRARRAVARQTLRKAKRRAGICLDCHRKAASGLRRCKDCLALNATLSRAAHARERAA